MCWDNTDINWTFPAAESGDVGSYCIISFISLGKETLHGRSVAAEQPALCDRTPEQCLLTRSSFRFTASQTRGQRSIKSSRKSPVYTLKSRDFQISSWLQKICTQSLTVHVFNCQPVLSSFVGVRNTNIDLRFKKDEHLSTHMASTKSSASEHQDTESHL